MDHMPWLIERAQDTAGEACGHALMASCPPEPFPELDDEIPFGPTQPFLCAHNASNIGNSDNANNANGDLRPNQQTWELSKADLATLLNLSKRLDLDGEITPVMAWGMVLAHPRLAELKREDLERLVDDLKGKVRCYGYEPPSFFTVPLFSHIPTISIYIPSMQVGSHEHKLTAS